MYHIGIITKISGGYEVCHSSNSKENGKVDTFKTKAELAAKWQYAGTLKGTGTGSSPLSDNKEVIELLEKALQLLK